LKEINKIFFSVLILLTILGLNNAQETNQQNLNTKQTMSGFLTPNGKPIKDPIRIDAGECCIIDLIQPYSISGDISGSIEMDYRIIVYGKCGSLPGTYNEEWIAYGTFNGRINNKKANAKLSYTAKVQAGGDVDGIIIFGQGVKAELIVYGNLSDGKLYYKGSS